MAVLISLADPSVEFDPVSCIDCHYSLTACDLPVCIRSVHACIVCMHRFFASGNCTWTAECTSAIIVRYTFSVTELARTRAREFNLIVLLKTY